MAVDTAAAPLSATADGLRRQAVRGGTLLLDAADYGMMTAGVLFVGLADMLAEAGVGKALIHKKELTRADLAQSFTLGLCLSTILYLLLFVGAAPLAVH